MANYNKELDDYKINNKILECPCPIASTSYYLFYMLGVGLSA